VTGYGVVVSSIHTLCHCMLKHGLLQVLILQAIYKILELLKLIIIITLISSIVIIIAAESHYYYHRFQAI
jgi:hypothetical protein